MMWAGSVKVGTDMEKVWDTSEAEEFYRRYFGMDKEYSFANPQRDYKTVDEEKLKAGGMEVNLELIRNYQARQICKHCWALRTLGMCIYEYNKVKVQKTVFRKKWERKEIVKHNVPSVKRVMDWNKYHRGLKKIYKAYRKGMFRSRWTLHKLLNQLVDKCSKNEVVVYETVAEERWKFQGWEAIPIEFELVCPLKILYGSADFLKLWERDQWDYDPKAPDHFQSWCIWDDDEREYQKEDRIDNSETIEQ